MSDLLKDSLLLATFLHLPRTAAARMAGAQGNAAAGFASRLARLAHPAGAGTQQDGHKEPAQRGQDLQAQIPQVDACQAADAAGRPGHAAEALAGLLDGHIAWQQRSMESTPPPEVAAVPLPQVANTVATALYQGSTRVHLQVMPPALGTVDVTVHLQGGVMQVVLQTETTETLEALQKDLPALRSTLRGAGLNVGSLRLTLRRKAATPNTEDDEVMHERS